MLPAPITTVALHSTAQGVWNTSAEKDYPVTPKDAQPILTVISQDLALYVQTVPAILQDSVFNTAPPTLTATDNAKIVWTTSVSQFATTSVTLLPSASTLALVVLNVLIRGVRPAVVVQSACTILTVLEKETAQPARAKGASLIVANLALKAGNVVVV